MSNLVYIERVTEDFKKLSIEIATGRVSLMSDSSVNDKYISLRRRLLSLSPITGTPPQIIIDNESGWDFWNFIRKHASYEERRQCIKEEIDNHYGGILNAGDIDLNTILLHRDLLVEDEIGGGGFGVVYRATQITLDAPRAVKVFDPLFYNGDEAPLRRFSREANVLSTLQHPNIVTFYDAGIAGNKPFIITEYVRGQNLQEYHHDRGNLSEKEVISICSRVLKGLSKAHSYEIYHRDIKPSNIMLGEDRKVKIVDFGATVAVTKLLTTRMTTHALGTDGYVAPELIDNPKLLSPGPDIYSVGVTAHYLLTGRQLFFTDPAYYLKENGISSGLMDILLTAMAPPENRFKTSDEMLEQLKIL